MKDPENNKEKKVSIVIPVYNAASTVKRCLDSLIHQTYRNIEVICIDDESKDQSLNILKQFAQTDKRIIVLSQKNKGPAATRNLGLSIISGEYLMFCDADDWFELNMVEEMVNAIESQNVDLVMCDCNLINLGDPKMQRESMMHYFHLRLFDLVNLDCKNMDLINEVLWNKIFKVDLLNKYQIVYPKKYEHDDAMFIYKYLAHAKTYYGLKMPLYNYLYANSNSIMGKVYNNKNKGHKFDFIYAWLDCFDYLKDCNNPEYIYHIKEIFFKKIFYYTKCLSPNKRTQAYKIFCDIVLKHSLFDNNNPKEIAFVKKVKSYKKVMKHFMENNQMPSLNLLSFSKNKTHRIFNILGIKLKLRRKSSLKYLKGYS